MTNIFVKLQAFVKALNHFMLVVTSTGSDQFVCFCYRMTV